MDLFGDLPPPSDETTSSSVTSLVQDDIKTTKRHINQPEQRTNAKRQKKEHFRLKGFVAERKGEREDMQDAHVIIDDFLSQMENPPESIDRMAYYAVFDGHVGPRASQFAAQHLHLNIKSKMTKG